MCAERRDGWRPVFKGGSSAGESHWSEAEKRRMADPTRHKARVVPPTLPKKADPFPKKDARSFARAARMMQMNCSTSSCIPTKLARFCRTPSGQRAKHATPRSGVRLQKAESKLAQSGTRGPGRAPAECFSARLTGPGTPARRRDQSSTEDPSWRGTERDGHRTGHRWCSTRAGMPRAPRHPHARPPFRDPVETRPYRDSGGSAPNGNCQYAMSCASRLVNNPCR